MLIKWRNWTQENYDDVLSDSNEWTTSRWEGELK